jgi:hypothetical protein
MERFAACFAELEDMPANLGAAHWYARAEEARGLAKQMNDADAKWRMQRIASDYDKIAKHVEAAANGNQPPSPPPNSS